MIVVAAIGTFGYNFSVVLPLLAGFVLHTSATGFGGLSAFLRLGSLVGAIGTAYTQKITLRRLVNWLACVWAAAGRAGALDLAGGLGRAAGGAGYRGHFVLDQRELAAATEDARRAARRVMGLYICCSRAARRLAHPARSQM